MLWKSILGMQEFQSNRRCILIDLPLVILFLPYCITHFHDVDAGSAFLAPSPIEIKST
jgi:hypothetical protein